VHCLEIKGLYEESIGAPLLTMLLKHGERNLSVLPLFKGTLIYGIGTNNFVNID